MTRFSRFPEYQWQEWDHQIEHDSKTGRLKALAEKALSDHLAGRTRPVLNHQFPPKPPLPPPPQPSPP